MGDTTATPSYAGVVSDVIFTIGSTGLTAGTHEDWPAYLSANDQITFSADGEEIQGVIEQIEGDGMVSFKTHGVVILGYTGGAPGVGWVQLAANGAGGVKVVTDGTGLYFYCLKDNTTDDEVTIMLPGTPYGPAA